MLSDAATPVNKMVSCISTQKARPLIQLSVVNHSPIRRRCFRFLTMTSPVREHDPDKAFRPRPDGASSAFLPVVAVGR
jgi:hypothetical protein